MADEWPRACQTTLRLAAVKLLFELFGVGDCMRIVCLPAFLIAACSAAPAPVKVTEQTSLEGRWIIIAIDGRAPAKTAYDQQPHLVFGPSNYGGNAGCNDFGGIGLRHDGRWYGDFAMANQMGCAEPLSGQDAAVHGMLASGPTIHFNGADRVTLATAKHRLELGRAGRAVRRSREVPRALIGTRWTFRAVDGEWRIGRQVPALIVEGDLFRLDTACGTAEGGWPQLGEDRVRFETGRRTSKACSTAERAWNERLANRLEGEKRYVTGPNGEIVLAGGGGWLTGEATRRGSAEGPELLAGTWQVEGGVTAASRNGARPPEVIFTRNAYYLWDGCNATEGLLIAYERQLLTHGSGLSTLANCMAGRDDPKFKAVVTSAPRFGTLIGGGLRLVSAAGELRLRRVGPARTMTGGVMTRLVAGQRFAVLGSGGGLLEILGSDRYRLTVPCGVMLGRFRTERPRTNAAYSFYPERLPEACTSDPATRTFLGDMDVAIGPHRDIALFAGRFGAVRARLHR